LAHTTKVPREAHCGERSGWIGESAELRVFCEAASPRCAASLIQRVRRQAAYSSLIQRRMLSRAAVVT